MKHRRIINELRPGINQVNIVARSDLFFQTHYDANNEDRRVFLDTFQIVDPGEIIGA